mmetsp:Transcript_8243/g.18441  ORF Transcript_8243/g.18441 Transcript_8243/m.18441 type:complete len:218 (+) Transcript_8243:141-794(+)|eukprot:CAMPEP_0178427942 /NCGR_PEP_ID=MMETSP0689_2-20121128/30012_1 /TAXON_ID=160604 /ORGANISM="Amphidinium massartii, Strain CS-259" /LENGTH=217 /DNA_ID=CAMNT_0020049679 /DNA_START=62 /DNA_END=715 /DNA_ORIENTATION=+
MPAPADPEKEEQARHWQAVEFRAAVESGDAEKVDEMIGEGISTNHKMTDGAHWTVLMLAANSGRTELVTKFTAKPGGRYPKVEDDDPQGNQAIMLASLQGEMDVCKILLEKRADPNASNADGETPLMMASAMGHTECVDLLLEAGANPDAEDINKMSAIRKASRWGRTDVVRKLLLKVKDDPRERYHCLLFAKLYEHEELRELLDPKNGAAVEAAKE